MVRSNAAGYSQLAEETPFDPSLDTEGATPVDPLLSSAISLAGSEPVFPLIQRIRVEVEKVVDTALSWDQLRSPTLNFSVVRPLTVKLSKGDRPAISLIFALVVCRAHFLERSDEDLAFAAVNTARADLCELLAIKLLSAYGTAPNSYELLHVLTTSFSPFAGVSSDMFHADEDVDLDELKRLEEFGKEESANALELAIFSKAKRFVKSPLVQQVIKAIDTGEVIYTPESNHALLQDNYKSKPVVEVYDWRRRPFLDHHRLRVPAIRGRLEFMTFSFLLALFLLTQSTYSLDRINVWEGLFIVWSIGFALDEWSSVQEVGLSNYYGASFNILDSLFCIDFFAFLGMRIAGLRSHDPEMSQLAFDTLGLAGCVLLPRLTISLLRGNVILLALSKMIREFSLFMGLAFLTASGFLCTFRILSRGTWDVGHIAWLMLKIWLGSAFLGFDAAQQFHPFFGPFLMVLFAVLAQTLLLTILISLLSNTFSAVQANAETEILYQMALRTIERAKADPLTCYVPPFNILALIVLFPLRWLASPRWFHKSQVYLARLLNLPFLLFLALQTRALHQKRSPLYLATQRTQRAWKKLPRTILGGMVPMWEGSVEAVVGKVFEREVTEQGRRVASSDEATPTTVEEEQADQHGKGKKKAQPPSPLKQRRGGAGGTVGDRLGSLTSPLARIFGPSAIASSASSSAIESQKSLKAAPASTDQKALNDRLTRIEEALQILLGEVVKSGQAGDEDDEKKTVPLTSLSGEIEPSYADEEK
ncbi:Calcium channel YVC1 [Rhodotorula toruloides]|nr:Calcium channel YVC1 [Rhodotorula toruloides]